MHPVFRCTLSKLLSTRFLVFLTFLLFFLYFYHNQRDVSGNSGSASRIPIITQQNFSSIIRQINGTKSAPSIFERVDPLNDYMNECVLPVYDYWDPSVRDYINMTFDPDAGCDNTTQPLTELVDGVWRVTTEREGLECSARCFEENGDRAVTKGFWMGPGAVDCEFLEAVCRENGQEVYGYIHTQIRPKPPTSFAPPNFSNNQPNVFVFMLDSLSAGMAHRSLPKTTAYLREELESVEFPFVNKVGENSKPNGIPLFFGKLVEDVRTSLYGGQDTAADWVEEDNCPVYLDDKLHIFKEFHNYGYVTLDEDDWFTNVIDWGGCKGYRRPPSDHHMHPFQLAYFDFGEEMTRSHLKTSCRRMHHAAMDYFEQFLNAYPDRPKFSFMWDIDHGHDYLNGYASYDQVLMDFLRRNQNVMDDSFVIVLGDHGSRNIIDQPAFMGTQVFEFERNNPFLSISVPKKYRKNGIVEVMRENSRQLQTHFDTRTTIMDILKYQPAANFSDTRTLAMPNEKGHSLLRRQPSFPRTCGHLPIPPEYCLCQIERIPVRNAALEHFFGRRLVDHVNQILVDAGKSWICETLHFQNVTSLVHFGRLKPSQTTHNYQISVRTTDSSPAHFDTILVHDEKTNEVRFGAMSRLDTYGKTGWCVRDTKHEKLCYCTKDSWLWSAF